jgi:hypothetical protein
MTATLNAISQNKINVILPELYELSNVILALTEYGRTDEWEVLQSTNYYRDVITFFEPVKNHPLLDSVNFSREKWEDYLSFRTDAFAFHFDENNKIYRYIDFYSVAGHTPFDQNLALINDFVEKSNFRTFYKQHKKYYDFIVKNYRKHYFIDKSFEFLNHLIKNQYSEIDDFQYFIVLSPLVYRMNCHRDITNKMVADFPSATPDFLNGTMINDLSIQLNGNHQIFTEIDHGFVNPISEKYQDIILKKFDVKKWDTSSGYAGVDVFNEYMTWAIWDIFIKENFPEIGDSLITQWQYQNASRGFFAQNIFSAKLLELIGNHKQQKLESVYLPLLEWCKEQEANLSIPKIVSFSNKMNDETNDFVIAIDFSEQMTQSDSFELIMSIMENGIEIGKSKNIVIKDAKWTNSGEKLTFNVGSEYKNFLLLFTCWGIEKPLVSKNGVFLQGNSYIVIKEQLQGAQEETPNAKNAIFITIAILILCIAAICIFLFLKKQKKRK